MAHPNYPNQQGQHYRSNSLRRRLPPWGPSQQVEGQSYEHGEQPPLSSDHQVFSFNPESIQANELDIAPSVMNTERLGYYGIPSSLDIQGQAFLNSSSQYTLNSNFRDPNLYQTTSETPHPILPSLSRLHNPIADSPTTILPTLGSSHSHPRRSPLSPSPRPGYLRADSLDNYKIVKVVDRDALHSFYTDAFYSLQQANCRHIAKAFVKAVEPKKQATYPYNGGKQPDGTQGDPEATRPPWWPSGVKHKEPDHLVKNERIRLLIHILTGVDDQRRPSVQDLRDAAQSVRARITPIERLDILEEIFRVREAEEKWENGELESDAEIMIVDRIWQITYGDARSQSP